MKKLACKLAMSLVMTVFMVTACQKQNDAVVPPMYNQSLQAESAPPIQATELSTNTTSCISCSTDTSAYDMTSIISATKFKEGSNALSIPGTTLKAVAVYQKGRIVQWTVQDAKGVQYAAESVQKTNTKVLVGDTYYFKIKFCVYIPFIGRKCLVLTI